MFSKRLGSVILCYAGMGFCSAAYSAISPSSITASNVDGNNIAANVDDKNPSTRWSGNGNGVTLEFDLGASYVINDLKIAFYKGDERVASFELEVSENGSTWSSLDNNGQEDLTEDLQTISIEEGEGRYFRVVGYGNSANSWTSLLEVEIDGELSSDGGTDDGGTNGGGTGGGDDLSGFYYLKNLGLDTYIRTDGDDQGELLSVTEAIDDAAVWELVPYENYYFIRNASVDFNIRADEDLETRNMPYLAPTDWEGELSQWTISETDSAYRISNRSTGEYIRPRTQTNQVLTQFPTNYSGTWTQWELISADEIGGTDGGSDTGGSDTGGSDTGGSDTGGSDTGGSDTGGSDTGGSDTGGSDTGGETTGGGGGDTYTTSPDGIEDIIDSVSGGDTIIVTGSGDFSVSGKSFSTPLTIRAQSIGGTRLESASISNSNNVIIQGFVFGPSEESTLLKIENSTNIQVLRNVFDHEDITENQTSIVTTQASDNISIGYNEFRNKNIDQVGGTKITGSFIKTQFDDPLMTTNLHVFRNHFNNIAPFLVNGTPAGDSDREAIAMGIADSQDVVTNNIVEYNLFENCDGENEIITVKTSNNVFRYNTFKNSMGSLSFRLGSNNEAYGNYFYGVGASASVNDDNYQTGGIRVYGSGHSIYDNYMENLSGISWRLPILIDSGDVNSSTGNDSHEVSSNISVSNNTIVNSVGGGIHIGSDNYSNQPNGISIENNTVVSSQGILFNNYADDSSNAWTGNQAYATGSASAVAGGSLNGSEVSVLSSSPGISSPAALTESDVGPSAN